MKSRVKTHPDEYELMDAEKVLLNPLNQSTSKQQYSFPKADRFLRCKTQNEDYHFYNIPSTRSRQGTTIGKSQRDSYSSLKNPSPPPLFYSYAQEGEFAYSIIFKNSRRKGYGFGLGRNDIKVNSFLSLKKDTPDPWAYDPEKASKKAEKQFSFSKAKKFSVSKLELPSLGPGPGSYQIDTSLEQTKQLLSNHPRPGFPKLSYSKTTSKRMDPVKYPPLYHPKTTAKGDMLDFNRLKKGAIIGSSQRAALSKANNPGPGQYKSFSEFISKGKK